MAGSVKGTAICEFGGVAYTLALDFNALCVFEERAGMSAFAALDQMETDVSAVQMRLLLWAMMQAHHPDLALEDVGTLIGTDLDVALDAIASGFESAMADKKKVKKAKSGKTTPKKKSA